MIAASVLVSPNAALLLDYVKSHHSNFDASHDWEHIRRVVRLVVTIAQHEKQHYGAKYDFHILKLSAYLHDIADAKYPTPKDADEKDHPHQTVLQTLLRYGYAHDIGKRVNEIILHVSYSKEQTNEKNSPGYTAEVVRKYPELAVIQDADR